jgi:hypothetical protein
MGQKRLIDSYGQRQVFWQCCSWIHAFNGQKDGDFTDAKTLATTSNSTQVAILVKTWTRLLLN